MGAPFEFLLSGHDTVEVNYHLTPRSDCAFDFEGLIARRESLRSARIPEPEPVTIGNVDFLLHPRGTQTGFPIQLSNREWTVACGPNNRPSFNVRFSSEALWASDAMDLHKRFLLWAHLVGLEPYADEKISRVDFSFDYRLSRVDFTQDDFLTKSHQDTRHRSKGVDQTLSFGKGNVRLRVYDKSAEIESQSHKTWFHDLWGCSENVWRVEWQLRTPLLKRFGLRTFEDLYDQQGDALYYLSREHDTLRIRTNDTNKSRWPLHPLWRDIQYRAERFSRQGLIAEIDPLKPLDEREHNYAVSLYGFVKGIGAMECLRKDMDKISFDDALARAARIVQGIHDPLSWEIDVGKKVTNGRLGRW